MHLQKLQCNKCGQIKYSRSRYGISKNSFICKDCVKNKKHETKSESVEENSNEIEA